MTGSDSVRGELPEFDGQALAAARNRAGLSQIELAHLVKYEGVATISKIEQGHRQPSRRKWLELADALGVQPDSLARRKSTRDHPTEKTILEASTSTPPKGLSKHVALLEAAEQKKANQARVKAIESAVELLNDENVEALQRWDAVQEHVDKEVLTPFIECAGAIQGAEVVVDLSDDSPADQSSLTLEQQMEIQHVSLQRNLVSYAGTTAASAGAGALAGAGIAAATYAATAALATASTGIAIGTLSGAAASSATMAALGGGAISAGGLGMAGGAVVLGGIVAAPILIAAGVAGFYMGKKMRTQARSEAVRIADGERQLRRNTATLTQIWAWIDQADAILRAIVAEAQDEVEWLQGVVLERGQRSDTTNHLMLPWTALSEREQDRFADLSSLAATTVAVLNAPFLAVANQDLPRSQVEEYVEWNNLLLKRAEGLLGL